MGWPRQKDANRETCLAHIYFPGLKVHVSIEGSGPDVVMIHGFAASLHTWSDVCAQMSKQFRIIRFDLPPFGLTGPALDQQGFDFPSTED